MYVIIQSPTKNKKDYTLKFVKIRLQKNTLKCKFDAGYKG